MLARVTFRHAPPLEPGDVAFVVAPSSPFPRDDLWRGLAWLRARYRLRISPGIFSRDGYTAGTDERRRDELAKAMVDPDVKAIVAARGGYGALRVAESLPWDAFARRPKWLVGFSDITVLHAMAWRSGVASVHGPNVTGLGGVASPRVRAAWLDCVEAPRAERAWRGLRVVHGGGGSVTGPLVGGNLTLVHAMAVSGRLAVPEGAVLALEDVGEAPYRVDRMLTSLHLGGHLARVAAVVLGGFERCAPPPRSDSPSIDEAIEACTRAWGVPVVAGAPFGHGADNEAFVVGRTVVLSVDELRFVTD